MQGSPVLETSGKERILYSWKPTWPRKSPHAPLKSPHKFFHSQTLTWTPAEGQWLEDSQRHVWRNWVGSFRVRAGGTSTIVPIVALVPCMPKSKSALAWWTLLAPPWWFPETPLHCKCSQASGRWQVATVYPDMFAEWPQTQHWCQIQSCISLVNNTHPTLVTPWSPASINSHITWTSLSD